MSGIGILDKNTLRIETKITSMEKSLNEIKREEACEECEDKTSGSNVLESNSDKEDGNESDKEEKEVDSGLIRKKNMEEIFKLEMR
jgi:hypothetical protein